MKKLICLFFAFTLFILSSASVFAADPYHVIKDWQVEAYYRADNVVEQKETITVDYLSPRHGLYRSIPYIIKVQKKVEDGLADYTYKVKIKNISVKGAPFEKSTENNFVILQIGDEDKTVSGLVTYEISYTYDIGDDRVNSYDEIFYSIIGPDNKATIEHVSYDIRFEKPLPEGTAPVMYTGAYGNLETLNASAISYDEYGIKGEYTAPINNGEALTLYAQLPEGYFENERSFSPIFAYIAFGVCALISLIILIYRVMNRRDKPVATVEFTPPDNISSAEVGYIIDSMAEDKDILSLIIWFADKGYVNIKGSDEEDLVIEKRQALPASSPHYMTTFYDGLFAKGDSISVKDGGEELYNAILGSKNMLASEFTKERALYSGFSSIASALLPLLLSILSFVGTALATDLITPMGIIPAVVSAIMLFCASMLAYFAHTQWTFASLGKRGAFAVGVGITLALGYGLTILSNFASLVPFSFFVSALWAACALGALLASGLVVPTKYCTKVSGKLLGLKNFIEKAELAQLNMLVHDNPSYFYSVLPYAYVFGLSDKWIKQFEQIKIHTPDWYMGTGNFSMMQMYWLTRSINNSYTKVVADYATMQAKSGGAGGTSFGSGGGFSGGGFGGGGSGSW